MEHFPSRQQSRGAQPRHAEPEPTAQSTYRTTASAAHTSFQQPAKKPSKWLVIVGALLALALLGALAYSQLRGSTVPGVDGSKYQAVFLTNGQVYFGKLKALNGNYYKLTNIYYLQASSTEENSDNPQRASTNQNSNVQLIKLGNEVHGPEDEMVIGRDQVLFFENLKADGKVSSTITEDAKNKK